ncbi:DNA repair protein RecO [Oceanidesulfovibrio marinus]|uniref:DNA repair protein RecO n=1 Tax=Oceanidesulfovibrio marinus TaxID=370038 RepID=A0A6P1ZIB2_9BACT|nr:DNA repair protein RecO [Oceanidesulfovibrio marinus]TVM35082.1 DNA repair protein RecO [Oceanidesulfovibrio marinus]
MEFTEKALVLKVGAFREADLWVRFLSPSRGMLTAFAFGGSKSKRRFCGCLDALCEVHFRVRSTGRGEYLCLEEGSLLNAPRRLRSDWQRLGLAMRCIKFLEAVCPGSQGAPEAYALACDLLRALEEEPEPDTLFAHLFRARASREQGFGADFERCAACGAPLVQDMDQGGTTHFLFVEEGRVLCRACAGRKFAAGRPLPLSPESAYVLGPVVDAGPSAWLQLEISPRARRECAAAVDALVRYHLGLSWENTRYKHV